MTNATHTLTLPDARCPYDTVAFHAQQCVEKYLKAWLISQNIDVPRTHDLAILCQRLTSVGIDTSLVSLDVLDRLNPFAVGVRYPDDLSEIDRVEATGALKSAREVRDVVRRALVTDGVLEG